MSINSIHQIPAVLSQYFGHEFIKRKVSGFNPIGEKSSVIDKLETNLHPMHHDWHELNLAIKESSVSSGEKINRGAAYLIRLAVLLENSHHIENISEIIERIKDKQTYHSAIFELEVLNFYLEKNIPIEIIKTSTIKTADFLITINKEKICVEAKLLQNNIFETNRKWRFITDRITKLAKRNKCCLHAHIRAHDILEKVCIENLLENIQHWSTVCNIPSHVYEFGKVEDAYSLKLRCTEHWDKIKKYSSGQPVELPNSPENAISSVEGVFRINPQGQTEVSNLITVIIEPFARLDFRSSIVSNLKAASKQSIENMPIIVHVGVPHTTSRDTFHIFENSIPQINRHLKGNSKKISGVVLQSFSFDLHKDFADINNNYIFIPNSKSETTFPSIITKDIYHNNLPEDFNFKGISINLNIKQTAEIIRRNVSANLAYFTSESALIQFRVFTSDKHGGSIAFQKVKLSESVIDTKYVMLKDVQNSDILIIDWESSKLQIRDQVGVIKSR